jgi:hypothetical protein
MRLHMPQHGGAFARIARAIADAEAMLGAIDLVRVQFQEVVRDVTVACVDSAHAEAVVQAVRDLDGVRVDSVSDRTFLMHKGGKIEVNSKVSIKTRDDLSMAYTPGVARVSMAIHEDRAKAWALTIKGNTVAIVSDGTAVLGLGDIGPEAAMPVILLERLRSAAAGRAGEIETRRRRSIVLRLTRTLEVMVKQIGELESEIADALDAHPDGEIFSSFFRSRDSVICAATLLGEIGDCRARYPHRDAIAADAGRAPVAVESGKPKNAKFRWACNKRLRSALGTLALVTRRWNPWAADRYANARARGHNHRRALRTLGRAWSRIIWRCWQTYTPYDPQRHTGLQQRVAVNIPTASGPRPTSQPLSGWPAPPSPKGRPAGPSAQRLTASRQPLSRSEVDTGRLSRCGLPRSGRRYWR